MGILYCWGRMVLSAATAIPIARHPVMAGAITRKNPDHRNSILLKTRDVAGMATIGKPIIQAAAIPALPQWLPITKVVGNTRANTIAAFIAKAESPTTFMIDQMIGIRERTLA